MEEDNVIQTRFVIIEKYDYLRYNTPLFDCYGRIFKEIISIGCPRIFISPGIYTREIDTSKIKTKSFEFVCT